MVRSVAAALACTVTAVVGHVIAGGTAPLPAVLTCFAGGWAIAWLLSMRRVTGGQLLGLLVLCQAGVHLAFSTDSMSMTGTMLTAHVVATAVSAWLLTRGETFAWEIADRLGVRLRPATRLVLPATNVVLSVGRSQTRRAAPLVHVRLERGPPAGS
jgi:hypothetical protein